MSMIEWTETEVINGFIYSNELAPEYEIKRSAGEKFFVCRVVAECDDIGPLDSFLEAENIVLKIGAMLVEFEEQAWRILAAQGIARPDNHYFAEAVGGGEEEPA